MKSESQRPLPKTGTTENRWLPPLVLLALGGGVIAWWALSAKQKNDPHDAAAARPAPSLAGMVAGGASSALETPVPAADPAPSESPPPTPSDDATSATMLPQQAAYLVAALVPGATAQDIRPLIDSAFAPFYQRMNLSEEDTAKLGDLLTRRLVAAKATLTSAAGQGLDVGGALVSAANEGVNLTDSRTPVAQLARDAVAPAETQIHSLLGDAGYQQYQAYAAPLRNAVLNAVAQTIAAPQAEP
jgi:LPXTG-motif cell wall-anchored protein